MARTSTANWVMALSLVLLAAAASSSAAPAKDAKAAPAKDAKAAPAKDAKKNDGKQPVPRWMEKFDPLLIAAHQGDVAEVTKLLDKGSKISVQSSYKHTNGWTALHFAADNGHEKVVELLAAKGAGLNVKDKVIQRTALHLAAASGRAKVVNVLIAKSAELNLKDKNGNTPLGLATDKAVIAFLKKAGAAE